MVWRDPLCRGGTCHLAANDATLLPVCLAVAGTYAHGKLIGCRTRNRAPSPPTASLGEWTLTPSAAIASRTDRSR
jgi:hypothetical protein